LQTTTITTTPTKHHYHQQKTEKRTSQPVTFDVGGTRQETRGLAAAATQASDSTIGAATPTTHLVSRPSAFIGTGQVGTVPLGVAGRAAAGGGSITGKSTAARGLGEGKLHLQFRVDGFLWLRLT
jgi:hypothetical protein